MRCCSARIPERSLCECGCNPDFPTIGPCQRNMAETRPKVAQLRNTCPEVGLTSANIGKLWPHSTEFRPMPSAVGPTSTEVRPSSVEFGQIWQESAEFGPNRVRVGPMSTLFVLLFRPRLRLADPGAPAEWQRPTPSAQALPTCVNVRPPFATAPAGQLSATSQARPNTAKPHNSAITAFV